LDDLVACSDLTVSENILDENENFESAPYKIRGCILTVCERMDDEFNKILKDCDAHGPEYVKRLKDEKTVCAILEKAQKYLEGKDVGPTDLCRIYLRRVEHLYYKFDPTVFTAKVSHLKRPYHEEDKHL
jgi:translation initiation factor 3 subunit C